MSAVAADPIRVCFPFSGRDLGGSHISALKLVAGFDRRRVIPVVVRQHRQGPLAEFLVREKVPFLDLLLPDDLSATAPRAAMIARYGLRVLPRLSAFVRQYAFDVVHTNDGLTHAVWGPAARLAGAKHVWHHRGDPAAKGANRLAPLTASHVITVSNFARPSRTLLPIGQRLSVVHSPFDAAADCPDRPAARAALLAELGADRNTRVLGFFGALIERKRPLLFVDTVHRLLREHPEFPVVGCIFGAPALDEPGVEGAIRQRAASLGIADAIRLMGFRRPVEPLLAATDILLVPAVAEPFGRTLIEAMLLGTPVVATADGGNLEAIEDGRTGFLVAPESAAAFVTPIVELLRNPLLAARIAEAARKEACCRYGIARHVGAVTAIYERLLRCNSMADEPVGRLGMSDG